MSGGRSTPMRAAVLLALEQECLATALAASIKVFGLDDEICVRYGARVSAISSRVVYPGLVRSSSIRKILIEERIAGRVLEDARGTAHRWWPVGLCDKLRATPE